MAERKPTVADKIRSAELARADRLRAALLKLVMQSAGDDITELLEGTAPSEQALDYSVWAMPAEAERVNKALEDAIARFSQELEACGLRGVLTVATSAYLVGESGRIRERLYGTDET